MSDHTQSIRRVGGASSTQSQDAQSSSGYAPSTSSPPTSAIPTNGSPPNARTTTPPGARTKAPQQPWTVPPSRTPSPSPTGAPAVVRPPVATGAATGPTTSTTTGSRKAASAQRGARGPRKARLQLRHVDTWSALKISLVLSVVMFFVWMVAVGILYGVLSGLSVFDEINKLWGQLGSEDGSTSELVTPGLIFGGAALIGAINIVLFTALATMATYIYNLSADLVGGLEVTLTERE